MPSRFDIPDEFDAQDVSPVLAGKAKWAQEFAPSATGERRIRYSQDVHDYLNAAQDAQEAHQENLIRTNKVAQNFYLRSQAMEQRAKQAEADLALRTEHAQREAQLTDLRTQSTMAKMEADHLAEARKSNDDILKHQQSAATDYDTIQLQRKVMSAAQQFGFGSPEFHKTVVQSGLEHPAADQTFVQQYVAPSQRSIEAQRAEAARTGESQRKEGERASAAELGALERERSLHASEIARYRGLHARSSDPAIKEEAQGYIDEAQAALDEVNNRLNEVNNRLKVKRGQGEQVVAPVAKITGGVPEAPITLGGVTIGAQPPAAASTSPASTLTTDIHEQARAAIAAGAPPDVVKERLGKLGGDPSKL